MLVSVHESDGRDDVKVMFTAEFDTLPRIGEYITTFRDDYFQYYNVVEVWHLEDREAGVFRPCLRVEIDD